jgi:ATP-dependent DNA helicase RecG
MDILTLKERITNSIQLGESHFREFKSAYEGAIGKKKARLSNHICRDIAECLVAFANADGGELLIGVEDDGTVTGIPHSELDIQTMLESPRTHTKQETTLPMVYSAKIELDTKWVLFFQVDKGTQEIYQLPDGRCVIRKDKTTVPAAITQIQFDRQEVRSREYDKQFVDGATVTDLDLQLLQGIADGFLRGLSPERYLQQMGLAEYANGLRIRKATLLLFAKDIQRWHPRCQVRILKVNGTQLKTGADYNVLSEDIVTGNIFSLLVEAWEALRPYLAYKTEFGENATFQQKYVYPESACREGLVNAIAHRDYSVEGAGIEVFIFDDRLEIKNPGAVLSTITIESLESLEGVHESRNSLIAKILRENKYMRELGEGIKRIFELMQQNELTKPVLYSNRTFFSVGFYNKSVFDVQQMAWLSQFNEYQLSNLQKRIVVLGMNEREITVKDIYKAISTDDRNVYDKEVTALRNAKILIEIRTLSTVKNLAKTQGINHQKIGRFKVQIPSIKEEKIVNHSEIYVTNLPFDIERKDLAELFAQVGKVEKIDLPIINNYPRGYAFIRFQDAQSVQDAIKKFNGYMINGRKIKVTVNRKSQ